MFHKGCALQLLRPFCFLSKSKILLLCIYSALLLTFNASAFKTLVFPAEDVRSLYKIIEADFFFRWRLVLGFYSHFQSIHFKQRRYQGLFLLFFFNCFWILWCDLYLKDKLCGTKMAALHFRDESNTQLQRQRQLKFVIFCRVLRF